MAFWNKFFGKDKNKEQKSEFELQWVEPDQNPWKVRLLDLRKISQAMTSTSEDPEMATNAVSYSQEDGLIFLNQKPKNNKSFESNLSFPIDSRLEHGVLFVPAVMEHKWAIYFHENKLLFIRSWQREVVVIAETIQEDNQLIVNKIIGKFAPGESNEFTEAVLSFLIYSHALNEMVPAPIPKELMGITDDAGLWAFSAYGNMAHFGHFEPKIKHIPQSKLRSHSLLHIAIARANLDLIKEELNKGANINALAGDGLSTLQWSITARLDIMEFLLKEGADPNSVSVEGATPIMNAVQSNEMDHFKLLIQYGADVNRMDKKGFTALHRAAEMGHLEMVKALLEQGANKDTAADGHTAISFAKARNHKEIIELLG